MNGFRMNLVIRRHGIATLDLKCLRGFSSGCYAYWVARLLLWSALWFGFGQSVVAAPGDVKWATVEPSGWVLQVGFDGLGTNGVFDFGFGTNNSGASKVVLQLKSLAYSTNGVSTMRSRVLYGTRQLRLPYPNQLLQDVAIVGGDTVARIALSDYVFQSDSNLTCAVAANWYSTNIANASVPVTNSSTMSYPKTIGNWTWPNWDRISGPSFPLRCASFNRFGMNGSPVACVVFTASDTHGHTTSQTVATPVVDPSLKDAVPVVEFVAHMDATGLNQGDVITCNFKAYPWVGDAGSVLDTADGLHADTTPYYHPLTLVCDKTGGYGRALAVVAPGGTSAGTVITNALDTNNPPAAFDTIANAAAAIQLVNNASFGHNDCGGGTILLRAGDHIFNGVPDVPSTTWLTISGYPSDALQSCRIVGGTSSGRPNAIAKFSRLNIVANASLVFYRYKSWWFDHCLINVTNSNTSLIYLGLAAVTFCTVSNLDQGFAQYSGESTTFSLIRGNAVVGKCSPWHCYTVVGNLCNFPDATGARMRTGLSGVTYPMQDSVMACNIFSNMDCSGSGCFTFWSGGETLYNGAAIVQNILENVGPYSVVLGIHPDSSTGNTTNLMLWNNVVVGERSNLGYNDTGAAPAYSVLWSVKNNVWDDYNIKSDTFQGTGGAQGSRSGNWANAWGVGFSGNANLERYKMPGGGGFLNYFMGLNSFQPTSPGGDPPNCVPTPAGYAGWIRDGSWQGYATNGTGSGNYRLQVLSPLVTGWLSDWVLPLDITGSARGVVDPPGAYAFQDYPPTVLSLLTDHGQSMVAGSNATITVSAVGPPAPQYYWYDNHSNLVAHGDSSSLVLTNVRLSDAGIYSVIASNYLGTAAASIQLDVIVFPSFTLQPTSLTTVVGSNVSFVASATGVPAPDYVWLRNSIAVAGATDATLTITNVQKFNAGIYSVLASNAAGSLLSSSAVLTVNSASGVQGAVLDPNLRLCFDFDEDFSVGKVQDVSGSGNDGYQFNPTNWITATNGVFGSTGAHFVRVGVMTNDPPRVYGLSQYIGVTNLDGFEYLTNGTISVWARFDATNNGHGATFLLDCGYTALYSWSPSEASNSWTIGKGPYQNYLNFWVYPYLPNGGSWTLVSWPDDTVGGDNESTTSFHLYTVTFDCVRNEVIAYHDGRPCMTNTINLPWLRVYGVTQQHWLCVGAMSHDGTPEWDDDRYPNSGYFFGVMDDVRIYDRVLPPGDVEAVYLGYGSKAGDLGLTARNLGASSLELSFQSLTNVFYQVDYRLNTAAGSWLPLGSPMAGTGAKMTVVEPMTNGPASFYRIHPLP